jgi:C4-dicarboxylate-specific signal transduction histidine kinase
VIAAVEETATQAERAGEIVRRLRRVIRRESAPRRPHSINRILREASELVLDEVGASPVRVDFDLEAYPDSVVVDRAQIQQVVVNLSCNALEAMAGHEGAGRLRIGSRRESYDRIRVEIEDDGPGVRAREHLSRLFSPWFTTKPDGVGLGLSVCRSVIEAHGGLLSYSDASHGGALFHFTLPSQSN